MEDRYECRLYDTDMHLLSVFDSWRSLSVERKINNFDTHTFSIDSKDSRVALFTKDAFFEVRRSNPDAGLDWYREYIGFHRSPQFAISADGLNIFTSYGRSLEDLLKRRGLAYTAPYSRSGPADDVMKRLVYENAGAGATGARLGNGVFPNFEVAPNLGQAPNWEGDRTYKPLLDVLQEISAASGADFNIVMRDDNKLEFRTYYPQLGVDRTNTSGAIPHTFGPEFGNMTVPNYVNSATEEVTRVLVLGQGEGPARATLIRSSPATGDSPYNTIELIRDARNEPTVAGLGNIADAELESHAAKENFTFEVIQTDKSLYGVHYNLGDLITVRMGNIVRDKKILGVTIVVAENTNSLRFDFGDLEAIPKTANDAISKAIRNIVRRLQIVEHSGAI